MTGREPCWFMVEFFILRPYRRRGLGRAAASSILLQHPGLWHVAVIEHNVRAAAFWAQSLAGYDTQSIQTHFDGEDWLVRELTMPMQTS